jgi:hypothetical protein
VGEVLFIATAGVHWTTWWSPTKCHIWKVKIQINSHACGMYLLVLTHFSHFALRGYYFISKADRWFFGRVLYIIQLSHNSCGYSVTITTRTPAQYNSGCCMCCCCITLSLSLTYLFTTLHHVIHTICFLLAFTSTTHGSCSLLHKAPLSFIHYTYLWLGCGLDRQGILVRLPGGTTDFHLLRSSDRLSMDHPVCYSTSTGGFFLL